MRQFYLGKNSNGYYRGYFIDPVTGVRDTGKSTHTKDKIEATLIAGRWLKEGVPFSRSHSRLFLSGENSSCQLNLKNIVEILSDERIPVKRYINSKGNERTQLFELIIRNY